MTKYDAIIIGAGQGGVPLAKAFANAGKRTALIERDAVGGTCINYGCTPTKTMVGAARVAHIVGRAREYGVRASGSGMDMQKVRDLKRSIVRDFREGSESSLAKTENLDLIYGQASFVAPRQLEIKLREGGVRQVSADLIFIDTGTRPSIPNLEGLKTVPFLDNASIMELDHVPDSLAILGAGYIGLEFGQMFARFGSKVTILDHGSRFLPREDEDVSAAILGFLRAEGIDVRRKASVKSVRNQGGRISLRLEDGELESDQLLVAAGRTPNTNDLNLELAGVEVDDHGFVRADKYLKTTAEGVYAIGDVKGGPAFTHISYDDFRILKANLLEGQERSTEDRFVPYTMYTDPQLGRIGLSEDEATAKGIPYRLAKIEMTHVARALEVNETRGFVKALIDPKSDKILGAAALGIEGGEIMSMIQLAMAGSLTAQQLNVMVFAHPTLAELLNNLFR